MKSFLKEVEGFALSEYAAALGKGDDLSPAERKRPMDKLIRYTGLDARYLDESNVRWDVSHFTRQLLRDEHETIGRMTVAWRSVFIEYRRDKRIRSSSSLITPPFTAVFTAYIRDELGYKTDMFYYPSGGVQPGITSAERFR